MTQIAGLILLLLLITGGLYATGAEAVLTALPFELGLIAGTAVATLLIANAPSVAREAAGGFLRAFRGSRWDQRAYREMLSLLHELARRARTSGHVSIEPDIEAPDTSELFARAPAVQADRLMRDLICDAFRLMAIDPGDPHRINAQMKQFIDARVGERMRAVSALHTLADALPALGIIAAVLGIIKTMAAIDQSTAVIGAMIASALLGTFLGVFLAYGLVGPVAVRFGQVVEDEAAALETANSFVSAIAAGSAPRIALEMALSGIPAASRPETAALDRDVQAFRFSPALDRAA